MSAREIIEGQKLALIVQEITPTPKYSPQILSLTKFPKSNKKVLKFFWRLRRRLPNLCFSQNNPELKF